MIRRIRPILHRLEIRVRTELPRLGVGGLDARTAGAGDETVALELPCVPFPLGTVVVLQGPAEPDPVEHLRLRGDDLVQPAGLFLEVGVLGA